MDGGGHVGRNPKGSAMRPSSCFASQPARQVVACKSMRAWIQLRNNLGLAPPGLLPMVARRPPGVPAARRGAPVPTASPVVLGHP